MTQEALYKSLQSEPIDVLVYGVRKGFFCPFGRHAADKDFALMDGRPHSLSSINIATWSLLSSSIKDYQTGISSYSRKYVLGSLLLFYIIVFLPSYAPSVIDHGLSVIFWWCAIIGYIPLTMQILLRCFLQKYLETEFHPAVHRVVSEVAPAVRDCGFEMEYVVVAATGCLGRDRSVLRFTPLDENEHGVLSAA